VLHIVWNEEARKQAWGEGRDDYSGSLFEILRYVGFSFACWDQESWMKERPPGITVIMRTTARSGWEEACSEYCRSGNAVLAIGGVHGLPQTLGIRACGRMQEGWVEWEEDSPASDLQSSFHCFDATLVEPAAERLKTWGKWKRRNGSHAANPVLTVRETGLGLAAMIGFDLAKTVCLIQQGVSVVRDGSPAPDGTAPIDEGFLKTDDGTMLDWLHDRDCPEGSAAPFYVHPIVDEMRILLVRVLYMLQERVGIREVQTWFWPNGLPAIGHISHDTDGNDVELAGILLDKLSEADVRSTWCTIMPGYPDSIYARIKEAGHEVALHYNAIGTEIPESDWTETHFRYQWSMLKEQVPDREIVSNKNHYLRWEGDTEFYRWCESAGIRVEQSKGGSKQGNKGFLFGTCHPYGPVGSPAERNRPFDIISLPTLSWDPPMAARCTFEEAKTLLRRSCDVYGVAHFLFHPAMVESGQESLTSGDCLVGLCRYGKQLGLEWWTSEQIWQWFQTRRQIRIESEERKIRISSEVTILDLTLILPLRENESLSVTSSNAEAIRRISHQERFGRAFVEVVLDVAEGETILQVISDEGQT